MRALKTFVLCVGCFLLFVVLSTPGSACAESLRIATEGAYPPFNFVDDKGELNGFDVDIARALCSRMRVECGFHIVAWENIVQGLVDGKYDAIVASMAKTPEREQLVDFTKGYYRSRSSFVGKADVGIGTTPEDLAGKVLAADAQTVQAEYLHKHFKDVAEITLVSAVGEGFALLEDESVDLYLVDALTAMSFLTQARYSQFIFIGDPTPADDPSTTAHIAVQKGDDDLRERFNEALEGIYESGEYARINKKYFPFNIY